MNPYYLQTKEHYENTKPIRGRAVEVRPAGKRRRDWEQITNPAPDTYAYRLYNTDCVIHTPERTVLTYGQWPTVTTAKFIGDYMRSVPCAKRYNALWASFWHNNMVGWYPICKQLFIDYDAEGNKIPRIEPVPVRVVDRKRAKELRKRLEPFINYGVTMLKLSDGWITRKFVEETRQRVFEKWPSVLREKLNFNNFIDTPEDLLPYYMYEMATLSTPVSFRKSVSDPFELDRQYSPESFKRQVYALHDKQEPEVYRIGYRLPDGNLFTNVVV